MVGGDIMMIIMIIIGVNNDVDDVTVWIVVEDESQWPKLKCTTILTLLFMSLYVANFPKTITNVKSSEEITNWYCITAAMHCIRAGFALSSLPVPIWHRR